MQAETLRRCAVFGLAALGLAASGCASSKLRCRPDPYVGEARHLSADYIELNERLLVEVNTSGYRIDQVWIAAPDGTQVKPDVIEYETGRSGGVGFGVGVGTGGGGTGVGVGAGTDSYGRGYIAGTTKLYFDRAAVGGPPWPLHIKLMSLERTTITLTQRAGAD